jgi:hypothetical protein
MKNVLFLDFIFQIKSYINDAIEYTTTYNKGNCQY